VGVPRSPPPRVITSPGVLSIEIWAVFLPVGKDFTNGPPFSCRQETRNCGLPIFNSLGALSPRPAPREKYRNSRAWPGWPRRGRERDAPVTAGATPALQVFALVSRRGTTSNFYVAHPLGSLRSFRNRIVLGSTVASLRALRLTLRMLRREHRSSGPLGRNGN